MSLPTVAGRSVEGSPYREAQMCLGPKWANSYYQFYLTGTTTPANVYQNGVLTVTFPSTGKVTADAYGRFPPIWLDPSVTYRVRFYNSANVQQWQLDPYISQLSTVGTSALSAYGFQIAPTGEMVLYPPNTGGTGNTLTVQAGALGAAALQLNGTLAGNSALIVNNSVTAGSQTATFAASNKPGTAASTPAGWLPITCDGVQYYAPLWFDNNFTPYTSKPTALNETITGTSATFGGNGVTSVGGGGSATPGNWFSPTTPGIGAGYYVNITRTGGTVGVNFTQSSGVSGTWTLIGAGGLTISPSAAGTAYGTYQISTSASGAPIVANGTISLTTFSHTNTYTSGSGTETVPIGASFVAIYATGPGGSGASAGGVLQAGGGGGGGAYCVSTGIAVAGGQQFTFNVGAGGAGTSSSPSNGNAGGTTTVNGTGVTMTANGGQGGVGSPGGAGGAGGTASGGNSINNSGQSGSTGSGGNNGNGANGGNPGGGSPGGGSAGVNGNGYGLSIAGGGGQVQFVYS